MAIDIGVELSYWEGLPAYWRIYWPALDEFFYDLRYACRIFRSNPGFTIVAVLCLSLGIAAPCGWVQYYWCS